MTILTYYEYLLQHNLSHSPDSYKQYRKYYQRLYQRRRRQNHKEITLLLTPDHHTVLKSAAIKHNQSLTKFITQSSLAYLNQSFITPNEAVVSQILQTLSSTYSQVEYLADQAIHSNQAQLIQHIYHLITRLEATIEKLLIHPDSLESLIQKTIQTRPSFYQTLTNLLKYYDHQSEGSQAT